MNYSRNLCRLCCVERAKWRKNPFSYNCRVSRQTKSCLSNLQRKCRLAKYKTSLLIVRHTQWQNFAYLCYIQLYSLNFVHCKLCWVDRGNKNQKQTNGFFHVKAAVLQNAIMFLSSLFVCQIIFLTRIKQISISRKRFS